MSRLRTRPTAPQPPQQPVLVWHRPDEKPVEFDLAPDRALTIGRDPSNVLVLDSPVVSKAHATIRYEGGEFLVEDLQSANGTCVNQVAVAVSSLAPGDTIHIGEARLEFIDRKAPQSRKKRSAQTSSRGKALRLSLAAVLTMTVMVIGGRLIFSPPSSALIRQGTEGQPSAPAPGVLSGSAPADGAAQPASSARTAAPLQGSFPGSAELAGSNREEPPAVRDALTRAREAGVQPLEALMDEAVRQFRVNRYREAAQLLTAILARDPNHQSAQSRLRTVLEARERAVATSIAEAQRASAQLRYDAAVRAWDSVLGIVDMTDPRYAEAQEELTRVRDRIKR